MTAPWGPALDAEVAYRHERIRAQFGRRRRRWFRRTAQVTVPSAATAPLVPAVIRPRRGMADATAGATPVTGPTTRRAESQTARRAA